MCPRTVILILDQHIFFSKSGSVTAGVLRGERARFQLFGDTMNLASRMESTGLPGRIQISYETAEQLKASGKNDWVAARCSEVFVKGEGEVRHPLFLWI